MTIRDSTIHKHSRADESMWPKQTYFTLPPLEACNPEFARISQSMRCLESPFQTRNLELPTKQNCFMFLDHFSVRSSEYSIKSSGSKRKWNAFDDLSRNHQLCCQIFLAKALRLSGLSYCYTQVLRYCRQCHPVPRGKQIYISNFF